MACHGQDPKDALVPARGRDANTTERMPESSLPKDFQYKWAVKNAFSTWYQGSPLSSAMEEHIPYTHMCTVCIIHTKSSNYLLHYETWASKEQKHLHILCN